MPKTHTATRCMRRLYIKLVLFHISLCTLTHSSEQTSAITREVTRCGGEEAWESRVESLDCNCICLVHVLPQVESWDTRCLHLQPPTHIRAIYSTSSMPLIHAARVSLALSLGFPSAEEFQLAIFMQLRRGANVPSPPVPFSPAASFC